MNPHRRPDSRFLVGALESRGWGIAPPDRRRRARNWVRAVVIVQAVVLLLIAGLLIAGRPGLGPAARRVESWFGYAAGDALECPAAGEPVRTDRPIAEAHVERRP